jgi:hypothetical protein
MRSARLAARLAAALEAGRAPGPVLEALGIDAKVRAEVAGGEPVGDALARAGLLPRPYALVLAAGRPDLVRPLAEAHRAALRHRRRFATVARGGVLLALATWFAVGVGVVFGLEPMLQSLQPSEPSLVAASLSRFFSPLYALATVGLAGVTLLGVGRLWVWTPGGRRSRRAATTRTLAVLLEAEVSVEQAARVAGRAFKNARVRTAGTRMAGGVEPGAALATAGLAPKGCGNLWSCTDGHQAQALAGVANGLATALEAEAQAYAPTLGRGTWGLFTSLASLLAVGYGVAMVQVWTELMRWPG